MPLPSIDDHRYERPAAPAEAFDDDIKFLAELGIRSIVAALDLPAHRKIFSNSGFQYFSLQIPDGYPPTLAQVEDLLAFYDASSLPMAVHCEGGVGRTGTLLAIILLHRGLSATAAVQAVKTVMPPALEIPDQLSFISRCEKLLHQRSLNRNRGF
jgi:protein-tyrosine phosphatase